MVAEGFLPCAFEKGVEHAWAFPDTYPWTEVNSDCVAVAPSQHKGARAIEITVFWVTAVCMKGQDSSQGFDSGSERGRQVSHSKG